MSKSVTLWLSVVAGIMSEVSTDDRGLQSADAAKWENAQCRAFLHWINVALKRRDMKMNDLLTGFGSGVYLINFVEILTGKTLTKNWSKNPNLRVHKINNCFLALEHLKENGVCYKRHFRWFLLILASSKD